MNSLWLDFDKTHTSFTSLFDDVTVDVCIIGAGIFGLSCAYYLSHLGYKVVVIEKDGIGEKTTRSYNCQNHKSTWLILQLFNKFLWRRFCK